MSKSETRIVNAALDEHLTSYLPFTAGVYGKAVDMAVERLGPGGVVGVLDYTLANNTTHEFYNAFASRPGSHVWMVENAFLVLDRDILFYRGQEVETNQGHVVVLGHPAGDYLPGGKDLSYILDAADERGAIKGVDHPEFSEGGLGKYLRENPSLLERFDFWEVETGQTYLQFGANWSSEKKFGKIKHDFPHLAPIRANDGNSVYEVGNLTSEIVMPADYRAAFQTGKDITKAVREGLRSIREQNLGGRSAHGHPLRKLRAFAGAVDHGFDIACHLALKKIGWK